MHNGDYRPLLVRDEGHNDIELQESHGPESPTLTSESRRLTIAERVPPEWVLLLLGCGVGLATGAGVVVFNLSVHGIHNLAWAGTPAEGASWLRVQPLSTTWHRILLIPVMGGVVVGVLHALSSLADQSQLSNPTSSVPVSPGAAAPSQGQLSSWSLSAWHWKPVIKAIQAAITLGTGSSLGPEGPSVDIGKAWAEAFGEFLKSAQQRKLALVAAGAAAGIASGFNAAVAGCFFAIETVLQPNSTSGGLMGDGVPPVTTAMIILASVLSSTVSNIVLGEEPAFTVPAYQIKSAAELPLYLLLGMVCGVISVIFSRLISLSTSFFEFLKSKCGVPSAVTPAIGGLLVGTIALWYPGVLYWGFTNVDEILHSRESASAPGPKRISLLVAAKIVATSLCKGSGLVGGIYAPSLFIGSAVGSVYGSLAQSVLSTAMGTTAEIAEPQAYALVGMAALLASACSVPLTSVLLLYQLTKDFRILLPLMGAVGLAYWVSSVANRGTPKRSPSSHVLDEEGPSGPLQSPLDPYRPRWHNFTSKELHMGTFLESGDISDEVLLQELKVVNAMWSPVPMTVPDTSSLLSTLQAMSCTQPPHAHCLVLSPRGLLLGILSWEDVQRETLRVAGDLSLSRDTKAQLQNVPVASLLPRSLNPPPRLLVTHGDSSLKTALRLMEANRLTCLPVVKGRSGESLPTLSLVPIGVVDCHGIALACQAEATKRMLTSLHTASGSH